MNIENLMINHYKKLLLVPLFLLIISLGIIGFKYYSTGEVVQRDISLAGGISITLILEDYNKENIESILKDNFPDSAVSIRELSRLGTAEKTGVIIDINGVTIEELNSVLEENFEYEEVSVQEIGASLGASFFQEMIGAIFFAFILMAITVFIIFRKFVPSLAVVLSAMIDILATLAIISLTGIKLSSAGIAAFLMVIGYSVDTDVLLTTRVLKRKDTGTLYERLKGSFKTGITMTITTIVALLAGLLISNSVVIKEMFGIILIALVIDIISTWVMNTSILVWYVKKNEKTV